MRQAVQVAAGTACAANIVPVAIDPNFVPPKGTLGFDFQPVGARTAAGYRPVVPGDPRLEDGDKPIANTTKDDLSFDSLAEVKRFRTEAPEDGEYRVIVVGAAGEANAASPFGAQVIVNGRTVNVAGGLAGVVAELGDRVRNVRIAGTSKAPMLVFEITINRRELDLQFLTGATVSGVVLEPLRNKSVLNMPLALAGNSVTSVEQCMAAETDLQQAASDEVTPKRRTTDLTSTTPGTPKGITQLSGN